MTLLSHRHSLQIYVLNNTDCTEVKDNKKNYFLSAREFPLHEFLQLYTHMGETFSSGTIKQKQTNKQTNTQTKNHSHSTPISYGHQVKIINTYRYSIYCVYSKMI